MSYQIKIDPKSLKAARFISRLQQKIQRALVASGKTQQEVADILGVDRSVINRRLKGSANITARSIAEFAYAFDKDVIVDFVEKEQTRHLNWASGTGNGNDIFLLPNKDVVSKGTIDPTEEFNIESAVS